MKTLNKDLAAIQLNQVIEQLEEMGNSDLQVCFNEYCISVGYEDTIVYNVEHSINAVFKNAWDILSNIEHYNKSDDYFYLRNGKIVSFNYLIDDNSPIDVSELAQWLISEDRLAEYDITVTTLEDMLTSIEDNINDDEMLLNTVCKYLHLNHITLGDGYSFDEKINVVMEFINSFKFEQLNKLITDLNINYQ